ncbi:MAG: ABC transporter ATP-binding protein [bacterium]|nr:ABC transporter ATP-binding protein [bacterium]
MLIETEDLTKVYPMGKEGFAALNGISLSIERGEFLAVMGPSGSGKSTLMNIIGCLDSPTSGKYLLEGEDVGAKSDLELAGIRNQKIGFAFQSFNLLPRATLIENVTLPLSYSRVPRRQRAQKAEEILQRVGLETKFNQTPTELSGGEQQRVALARALVNNPVIICADEPTGNLDTATSREIMEMLSELNKDGTTIILVTHDSENASYAKRIITLRDGRIVR